MAMTEALPRNCEKDSGDRIDETVARLISLKSAGNYGVVLWLSPENVKCLLESVKRAQLVGTLKPGELTWFLPADIPVIEAVTATLEIESIGMIALSYGTSFLRELQNHWFSLNPILNDYNPWTEEIFQLFFACKNKENCAKHKLDSIPYTQNSNLLNTVNAIFSVAAGLENVRQYFCGFSSVGLCQKFRNSPNLRQRIFDSIRGADFRTLTGSRFNFAQNRFGNEPLQMLNFVRNGTQMVLMEVRN